MMRAAFERFLWRGFELGRKRPALRWAAGITAGLSLFLVVHNHVLNLLPGTIEDIPKSSIQADTPEFPRTFVFPFVGSAPDGPYMARSRSWLLEDHAIVGSVPGDISVARLIGQGNWAHEDRRVVFSTMDGSDPRTNPHEYAVYHPWLYQRWIGRLALLGFGLAVAGLYWLRRPELPGAGEGTDSFRRHLLGAALLFAAGLYCSTGTLTPYANTSIPHVAKASSYLYNTDHVHFQALFNFVDGRDRPTWDNALFLRRILYNVLAYPFMKAVGWEVGGTLASMSFAVAGFALFVRGVRRRVGTRGAVIAAWLLALYPGAAYWAGLPYFHALIFPGSLLLMLALVAIAEDGGWRPVIAGSLLMGVANLGYEFVVYFLPATVLLLAWRRRWAAIPVAVILQAGPLVIWALILQNVFDQTLANNNSSAFGAILGAYVGKVDSARWLQILNTLPEVGASVYFGANFLFLPLLFLVVVGVNALTSRIRPHPAEAALLGTGLALFLFNNVAPDYVNTWQMRGTWIARIYQPTFPALIWFVARWWQHLPDLPRPARVSLFLGLALLSVGNALVVFGPILNNPGGISERAFYSFYDHAEHSAFERNLARFGRRPLGFAVPRKE